MEPVEIEFVGSDDPPPPPVVRQRRPRSQLLRLALVVLVAGGAIAWVVTRSHSGGQDPVAVPATASRTPPVPLLTVLPSVHDVLPPPGVSISVACDVAADCKVATAASDRTIAQALAEYLPTADLASISTTIGREHGANPVLAERVIDVHLQSVDLLVRVLPYQRPEPDPTVGISPTPPGLGSAFFRFVTAAFVVDVQWTGTDATPPPVTALQSLADDPRLESIG
jgi:hypothetical protein